MSKHVVTTAAAPAAIGPYSQAVGTNGLLFVSGQLPVSPDSGEIAGNSVREQTEQCIANLENILKAGGCCLADVVKTSVFMTDLSCFAEMNKVYATHFLADMPARVCVEVSRLPRDAKVEIEAIAVRTESRSGTGGR